MATQVPAVTPFNFHNHNVRVVMRDASPWFVAADVCETLGYKNPSKAIADHLDNDEKSNQSLGLAGKPLIIINESGLYALVLRSRKPEARKFAKWVTSEVLPAIRKTGKYEDGAQPKHPNINDEIAKLADPNIYPDTVIREIGKVVSARMDNRLSTVDDRRGLVDAVNKTANLFPALGYNGVNKLIHQRYNVNHTSELTVEQVGHAVQYLQGLALDCYASKRRNRYLVTRDDRGVETWQPIGAKECITSVEEWPRLLAAADNMIETDLLSSIAQACLERLSKRTKYLVDKFAAQNKSNALSGGAA